MSNFFLWLSHFLYYRIGGWTAKPEIPEGVEKAIIIIAPHTANSDFPIGLGVDYLMSPRGQFLAKRELFDGPFGFIFKSLGGLPVDRSKANNLVDEVTRVFSEHEQLFLVVAPEGTRSITTRWKTGFYHMAKGAGVPIILAYMDYAKKECGFGGILHPSDNQEKDFVMIEDFYRSITARYPENFNPRLTDGTSGSK